jgi:SAM-dependent methyltransferase
MGESATVSWWRDSAGELGLKMMDKLIAPDAGWEELLETGRCDVRLALEATGMKTGSERTLLDLGCGVGRLSFALADHFGEVLGLDVSPSLIAEAERHKDRSNVSFYCGDGHRIHLNDRRQFDTIFSFEVLHYLDPEILRENFASVFEYLKPGGEFVFEINCATISHKTRLSMSFRSLLYHLGVREWRGWPNAPGFRRFPHGVADVRTLLNDLGFEVRNVIADNPRQTWFVAGRPDSPTQLESV